MADMAFGEILAQTRRQQGLDVQQVSDALRIRPDILRAIEIQDFAKMPARGFARNQVSAYARYLGLDPVAITQDFNDAYNEFERQAYKNANYITNYQQPSHDRAYALERKARRMQDEENLQHRNPRRRTGRSNRYEDEHEDEQRRPRSGQQNSQRSRSGQGNRGSANVNRSRNRQDDEQAAARRPQRNNRSRSEQRKESSRRNGRGSSRGGIGASVGGGIGYKPEGNNRQKIIIAVVAIILIVIIASTLARCSGGQSSTPSISENGGSTVQVTGGSESTASTVSEEMASAITATPAIKQISTTEFTLEYSIPAGDSCWLQITYDGTTPIAESVDGPSTGKYVVTSTAEVTMGNPSAVTITINGQQVDFANSTFVSFTLQEDGSVAMGDSSAEQ